MSFLDDLLGAAPRILNSIGTGISAGGDLAAAASHEQFGQQAQQSAQYQATQLRQNAGQTQASSQRAAYDADLQSKYIASTTLARAAASGGGASDPTVVNLIAKNASEGAYRQAVALYQGDAQARLMNLQADTKEYEGNLTRTNSDATANAQRFKAGSTLMNGFFKDSSLRQRFGGNGPDTSSSGMT